AGCPRPRVAVIRGSRRRRVEAARIEEVAAHLLRPDRGLPLELGGEAGAGPAGVRVRLVIAHVTDRLGRVERPLAAQTEYPPFRVRPIAVPVERRRPAVALPRRPAVGEPQVRTVVTAVLDESQVLAVV